MQDRDDLTILGSGHSDYPGNPLEAKLETFENRYSHRDYTIEFHCPEFTSLCPITGQPDFATINIRYSPDLRCIESKSLKLYLFSFRNSGMFHEEITNRILDDIVEASQPRWACVTGRMNARGGITIEVVATHEKPNENPKIGRS